MTNKKKQPDRVKEELFTYEMYAAMPEDGNRYEIVDGKLELMPGPNFSHQSIGGELFHLMKLTCRSDYIVIVAPFDVILSERDVRQPDVMAVHRSRAAIVTMRGIEGPPDLVVEVMSPGSRKRDRIGKMATYAKYDVPEYWIIDPDSVTLDRYVLRGGRYELDTVFEEDDLVASEKMPCITFRVRDLFSDVPNFQ